MNIATAPQTVPNALPLLTGKKGLVVGIANDQSIAHGCAQAMQRFGATLTITYLNAKAEPHVRPLAEQLEADLDGRIEDSSATGFARAMDMSCQSFPRLAKLAEPLVTGGGTLVTMRYYGTQRVIDHYGIMGPVKAALEASVRYLAAEPGPPADSTENHPLNTIRSGCAGILVMASRVGSAHSRIASCASAPRRLAHRLSALAARA